MMKALETNVLHASDVIYWLDGSSDTDSSDMQRINHTLSLKLDSYPRDLKIVNTAGKTGLLRKPTLDIIDGRATEAQRAIVPVDTYTLSGYVSDPKSTYHSRYFSITAGNTAGHGIVLYPTTLGSRMTAVGGLYASLRWQADGEPAAWALATLTITVPGMSSAQVYNAQADARGELVIPWPKLPPLTAGQTHYNATLALRASASVNGEQPIDPDLLAAVELESTTTADTFSDPIGLQVVPAERLVARSATKDHLTVKPS